GGPLNRRSSAAQPLLQRACVSQAAPVAVAFEVGRGGRERLARPLGLAEHDARLSQLRQRPAAEPLQAAALAREADGAFEQDAGPLRIPAVELERAEVQRQALQARRVLGALVDRRRAVEQLQAARPLTGGKREHPHPRERRRRLALVARGTPDLERALEVPVAEIEVPRQAREVAERVERTRFAERVAQLREALDRAPERLTGERVVALRTPG